MKEGRKEGRRKRTPKYNKQKPETPHPNQIESKHGDKQKNKTKEKKLVLGIVKNSGKEIGISTFPSVLRKVPGKRKHQRGAMATSRDCNFAL
jgi:hypothetical protein